MKRIEFLVFVLLSTLFFAPLEQVYCESLSTIPFHWKDDAGKDFEFASLAGKPFVVTMMYGRCKSACPLTINRLKNIERTAERESKTLDLVLVSFEPSHDSPAELAAYKKSHEIDRANWHLLHGTDADVRKLSVLLGISYEKDPETKEYIHGNKIVLFNRSGEVQFSLEGLASNVELLVNEIPAPQKK